MNQNKERMTSKRKTFRCNAVSYAVISAVIKSKPKQFWSS